MALQRRLARLCAGKTQSHNIPKALSLEEPSLSPYKITDHFNFIFHH